MDHPTAEKTIRKRVRKACLHCKRAKTSCSDVRPCKRCVRLHLSDTCIDPPSSSSSAEDRELWEDALRFFITSKNKRLTMSEQNIVSQIRNVTSNGSPPSPTSSAEQTIPQSIRITQTIQYKAMTDIVDSISKSNNLAVSKWDFPNLTLSEHNNIFSDLSSFRSQMGDSPSRLFTCRHLFSEKTFSDFQEILDLLQKQKIASADINQKWIVRGVEKDISTKLQLLFDDYMEPTQVLMISQTVEQIRHTLPKKSAVKPPPVNPKSISDEFTIQKPKLPSQNQITLPRMTIPDHNINYSSSLPNPGNTLTSFSKLFPPNMYPNSPPKTFTTSFQLHKHTL